MKVLARAIAGASMLAAASAGHAQLINGSFETATVDPGEGFVTLWNGDTSITGWTVINGARLFSIDYIGGYWDAFHGTRSVDLSGEGQGGIYQDVNLTKGWYVLNFAAAGNPDAPGDKPLTRVSTVSADSYNELFSYAMTGSETHSDMNWQTYQTNRFYSDGLTRVSFISGTTSPFGNALDNVSISLVPEPATWAMMLIGFGAIGSAVRRRRRNLAVSYA